MSAAMTCLLALASMALFMPPCISETQVHELGARFQALNRKVVTRTAEDLKRYTPQHVAAVTAQLRELLTVHIESQLSQVCGPRLAGQLAAIQGEYRLSPEATNAPFVSRAADDGRDVWITAVLLFRGGAGAPDTKALLQVYVLQSNRYKLVGERTDDFDGHSFFAYEVAAHRESEVWVLAYGSRLGDNHNRLKVVLYSFDGDRLAPIWQRAGLSHGELTVGGGRLRLSYRTDNREAPSDKQIEQETFVFSRTGLEPEEN